MFQPKNILKIANWVGWPLIAAYIIAMFIAPLIELRGDWNAIQRVWDRWQSLNVGMLALFSSLLAFNISRFNLEQQRERDFTAARAFLPEALSELTEYCRASMMVFAQAWRRANDPSDNCKTPLTTPIPALPHAYREVFRNCIKFAKPEAAHRLSEILRKLQIHHSRMESLYAAFESPSTLVISQNVISLLYCVAEVQVLLNKTFNFARSLDSLDTEPLKWDDFRTALFVNDIRIEEFTDLQGFIERAIERSD